MNDQGLYGFGQLATILRARYCEPKIESADQDRRPHLRVKEILEGVFGTDAALRRHAVPETCSRCRPQRQAESATPTVHRPNAGDNTPIEPGAEARKSRARRTLQASVRRTRRNRGRIGSRKLPS